MPHWPNDKIFDLTCLLMFALFYQHIDRQEEHDNVSNEHFED